MMRGQPQESPALLQQAHARMPGRTGYPVRPVHYTTDIAPKAHRNQHKTDRHPPGTHRTADTSPQGIYTPSQPSGYMAHIRHRLATHTRPRSWHELVMQRGKLMVPGCHLGIRSVVPFTILRDGV